MRRIAPLAFRLALCAGLVPAIAAAEPRLAPGLAARAAADGQVRVLVELATPTWPEHRLARAARSAQRARIADAREALRAELRAPHALTRGYRSIPWVALEVGPEALAALERSPRVRAVRLDRLRRPSLDVSVPRVQADQTAALGFDGAGQVVAVLDTGVDSAHPNLAGKLVAEACFAQGFPAGAGDCPNGETSDTGPGAGSYCTYDNICFHGTHVAGTAVGDGAQFPGVARGGDLISIQVFSAGDAEACDPDPAPCAIGWSSDLLAALEHVQDELLPLFPIAAVNLSLGGELYTDQEQCDLDNAAEKALIDNLRAAGVATAAASGNEHASAIAAPACISSAVSVGAVNDFDGVPAFSNGAPFLSLFAPGQGIRAPRWQTTGFMNASGTSMSTPHVAAAFAILRQARPLASVSEMLAALQTTGVPIDDPDTDTTRIEIRDALDALPAACENGLDDDGDGDVDVIDPGCDSEDDASEHAPDLVCDDGIDNDDDGLADVLDPGCGGPLSPTESPACDDGLDNDGDGGTDWDGVPPDLQCVDRPWRTSERPPACGIGPELALLALPLTRLRRRSRTALGA